MTRKTNLIALAAGMFFVTAAGFFATAQQAEAANALNCKANSRAKVIECCNEIVNKKRPVWMVNSGQSCSSAAVCTKKKVSGGTSISYGSKSKYVVVCSIQVQDKPNKPDKPDKPDRPDEPDRPDNPDTPDNPDNPNNPDPQRPDPTHGGKP